MAKFEVDGVEYELVDSPTFGEAKAIEKVTGRPFSTMSDENQPIDVMQAFVWISMRRSNPDITFDDLDDLDMSVLAGLQEQQGEQEEPAPLGDGAE